MKKFNYSYVFAVAAALASVLSSCVNEEYDVDNLNTEITVAAEGLTLPIGSTKQLALEDLLSEVDADVLQVLEGGGYAFRINETLNLGDQLPDLKGLLDIPDVAYDQEYSFDLSGIDMESVSIDADEFTYDFDLADGTMIPEVALPEISISHRDPMGIWEYGKAASEMKIDVDDVHLNTDAIFHLPSGITVSGSSDVAIDNLPDAVIDPVSVNVIVKSECPEGISNISDIKMSSASAVSIRLSLVNSFLSKGSLIPDLVLDLDGVLTVGEGNGSDQIVIDDDFVLNEENGYVAVKSFRVQQLNAEQEDWTESLLEMERTLVVSGTAALESAMTNADLINSDNGGMSLRVDVEFSDLLIESMMMDVETDPVKEEMDVLITLDDMTLPQGVKSVDKVFFTEDSTLDLIIDLENIADINGLNTNLNSLVMTFPEEISVRDAIDGKVVLSDVDLADGLNKKIHIDEISLPAPVDGKISYSAHVLVEAEMTAQGRICSADVPRTEEKDGVFIVEAVSHFEIDDYILQTEGFEHELNIEPQTLSYKLPDAIADVGTFSVIPEGDPVLTLNLSLPQTELEVETGESGVSLSFPDFFIFKNVDEEYGFDSETNSILLKGKLPEQILLPIDRITLTPVRDPESGGYYVTGEISISGSVQIPDGEVAGKDLEQIATSSVAISALIPEIIAAEIHFDHFNMGIKESLDIDILKASDFPEQVKKISLVDLSDVEAVIDVTIDNLPDIGKTPIVDIVISMPSELVLDSNDERVDGNTITISEPLKDNKIDIDPIRILAIDLSDFKIGPGNDLTGSINIDASISADDPEIDLSTLDGDVVVGLSAGIKDIEIEKVTGNVGYDIDGINQNITLTGLPDFVRGENFVLDLANPHLIIKAKTNMGIPVKGKLLIEPIIGGSVNKESVIEAELELPYTETAAKTDSVVLWFGGDQTVCPADYVFVKADINKLIKKIPDELRLSLEAGTDPDQNSIVEPSADYILDVEYDFIVPLEFGPDLRMEICDTITGLPEMMGQLLEKNTVQLAGSITSSLPLALEMNIDMLDDNNKVIALEKPAVQKISACSSDGSATVSPLDLTLAVKKGASVTGLSSLKVTFKVTAPNHTGLPLDKDDFVQAEIKLSVPEGITLDFADMNSDENL